MESLSELINKRRSIRKYLEREVEKEKIESLIESARMAPSACNAQPWRIVVVKDKKLKDELIAKGLGGFVVPNSWAKTAPVIVVVCSDLSFFTHTMAERVQGVQYHLIDIGICMEHMALKAVELGLGTCYIGWFNGKQILKMLNLPSSWKVECLLTLGYPAEIPDATPRKPLNEISIIK
ncbi:MAG: nitroreductase family protein [Elusimicrobia bacterium]|nr:nitroreductase family protein [Elusimicrobiota bacterium]